MSDIRRGPAYIFGDNINTDIISPPQYMELSVEEAAPWTMSGVDPDFATRAKPGTIIVAGRNFGSGSSRELAPLSLRHLKVGAIVAKFFARIFYRNAINIGLPILECEEAADEINANDEVSVDFDTGIITDITTGKTYKAQPFPPFIQNIIKAGGLLKSLKEAENK